MEEEILQKGVSSSPQEIFRKQYFYSEDAYPKTTYQVDNLYIFDGHGNEYDTFYEYDSVGNITVIRVEDKGTVIQKYSYEYDSLNRLIRENDYIAAASNKSQTVTYTYDRSGNITSKKEYAYTEGSLDGLTYKETAYGYAPDIDDPLTMEYADVWNDQLVSYGGQTITYDAIGNPLTYGSALYSWKNGRQLASVYQSTSSTYINSTFKYNDEGIRTEKTSIGIKHEYSVSGGQINREVIYSSNGQYIAKDLRYYYDAAGYPAAIRAFTRSSSTAEFTSNIYYLLTDMQGDVIAIYNQDGQKIYEYAYDAWGNILRSAQVATGGNAAHAVNPFRYRGYYYDTDTGLYYLQSRYYNPQWGRFINVDSQINTGSIISYNMFAYCENNPVMLIDSDGHIPFFAITATIGAVAGAIVGGIIAYKNGGNVLAGAAIGAAAGGLIGLGAGAAAGALLAGSVTATASAVAAGASTLATTVATGGLGAGITYLADNLSQASTNFVSDVGALFTSTPSNAGKPFVPNQKPGTVQIGVDPNTLISNGRSILQEKLDACINKCTTNGGIYGYIEMFSNGVIYDGHHRVEYAKMIGAAVDVIVRQGKP